MPAGEHDGAGPWSAQLRILKCKPNCQWPWLLVLYLFCKNNYKHYTHFTKEAEPIQREKSRLGVNSEPDC